jgi:alpha-methylacyl-CoA racemase
VPEAVEPAGPRGPLAGVKVVELASIGPIPFCGMVLSDMGADVVRIDRAGSVTGADPSTAKGSILDRGRRSIGVDLKQAAGVDVVLRLVEQADVLIEGYRPGVTERLGFGPDECLARNPRLVYGRLTGWGREGPLADRAGHDIDYIALGGALGAIGRPGERPVPPLNVVGDFGGGGLLLAYGIACALFHAARTGEGQVVDTAMVDGTAMLMVPFFAAAQSGFWQERGTNMLDGGAPYYDTYRCADGRDVAVGAIEPQFYAALLAGLGLDAAEVPDRDDRDQWPKLRAVLEDRIATRTRDEWADVFESLDGCLAPVLDLLEVAEHPHNVARSLIVEVDGAQQPNVAPRLSATPGGIAGRPCVAGQHTDAILEAAGYAADDVTALRATGAVA